MQSFQSVLSKTVNNILKKEKNFLLGDFMRLIREAYNMTRPDLAPILRRDQNTLYMIESNRVVPRVKLLKDFAEFFDVPVDILLDKAKKIIQQRYEDGELKTKDHK